MDEVRTFVASLALDVRSGRIRVVQPRLLAQPPMPGGSTMWTEDTEVQQVIQEMSRQK
jgi:hypothetical protein